MLAYILLFFRVTKLDESQTVQNTQSHKLTRDSYGPICQKLENQILDFKNSQHDEYAYYFCDKGNTETMKFNKCTFQNIKMIATGTFQLNSIFIHSKNTNLEIENSIFLHIQFYKYLIDYDTDTGYEEGLHFTMDSNYFDFCSPTYDSQAEVIHSDAKVTTLINNTVNFEPSTILGQAFYIYYYTGCIFKGNKVRNAKYNTGSGVYFYYYYSGEKLEMSDCLFSNCRGDDGGSFYIQFLKYDLELKNITFDNYNNNNENGYMMKIIPDDDADQFFISFIDCTFTNIDTNSKEGGGISLFFKVSNKLIFENTLFEHIKYDRPLNGGGAIIVLSTLKTGNVNLIVDNCTFSDVSTTGYGGAIYFNSFDYDLSVTNSIFKNTKSDKEGQAICISQCNSNFVDITSCQFIDCCSSSSNFYVLDVFVMNLNFLNNNISFSDSSKSCGCIKSGLISKHNYIGNIFRNAQNNKQSQSAGIDENIQSSDVSIEISNNVFEGFSGLNDGLCFFIRYGISSTQATIHSNIVKDCSTSGALFKVQLESMLESYKLENFSFINNEISDQINHEFNLCPQVHIIYNDEAIETIEFDSCHFENNHNQKDGGALIYLNKKLIINSCEFSNNRAGNRGSALFLLNNQIIQIKECAFVGNNAEQGSSTIYIQTNNDKVISNQKVEINDCIFDENDGKESAGITVSDLLNAQITIEDSNFTNCGKNGYVIDDKSDIESIQIQYCVFNFSEKQIGCGGISINGQGKIDLLCDEFIGTVTNAGLFILSSDTSKEISIDKCIFDSCSSNKYCCFDISTQTNLFTFKNNIIKNVVSNDCNLYLGSINLNDKIAKLTLFNISFADNLCSSLYGGGTGLMFNGISELLFDDCFFIGNQAKQDKSVSRPIEYGYSYYNGDGGAIQIGCQNSMKKLSVIFNHCEFKNNKAFRHGGAIAIQTIKDVQIKECTFQQNQANYKNDLGSSELLFENHFHQKTEGRGGAIYINPSDSTVSKDLYMETVKIENSKFISNNAYDGYAMYIEGEDPGTSFIFLSNYFTNNYNENNYKDDESIIFGAVIATEIHSITNDQLHQLETENYFIYSKEIKVDELSYVDFYGKTPSKAFTESNFFPSNNFTLSQQFSKSEAFSVSNKFTNSDKFIKTDCFSQSNGFTESKTFQQTNDFTKSNAFSYSNAFSDSQTLKPRTSFSDLVEDEKSFSPNSFSSSHETSENQNTNSDSLITDSDILITSSESPIINSESSIINSESSMINSESPIINSESSIINSESSIINSESSIINSESSIINSESPIINSESPIINSESASTTIKTDTQTDKESISQTSITVINRDPGTSLISRSDKKVKLPLIIGLVVGILALLVIISIVIIFIIRKKRKHNSALSEQNEMEETIESSVSTAVEEFNNPLYNGTARDPFEQEIDETEL